MEIQSIFNKNRAFYEEFLAGTDQKKNASDFLIERIVLNEKPIKILSVGAGAGDDVAGLLQSLKARGSRFDFFYLDPSQYSFSLFKKRVAQLGLSKNLSGVAISNLESFETAEKFDAIIASHVFYYIRNWERSLVKLHKLLADGEAIFIFMQSRDSDNYKFRNRYLKKIFGKDYREKKGEELIATVKNLGLSYESQKIVSRLDIPLGNGVSQRGEKLLSFLLRTDYGNLDQKLRSDIQRYLLKNAKTEDGKKIFELIDNSIVISKPQLI